MPKTRYETVLSGFLVTEPYLFSDQNGTKTIPFRAAHTYMCYIREYRPLPPPPGIVFTVGHEEMIYSPYFIAQSERHFARLIRMNFMIYNRNFAQQSRQRVVWKTLKYPHDKQGRVQTHPTK